MKKFFLKFDPLQVLVLLVIIALIVWKLLDTPSKQDKTEPYKDLPKHTQN